MAQLIFHSSGDIVDIDDGALIEEACEAHGVFFACGGQGRCGSCIIRVVEGAEHLSPLTEREQAFFGQAYAGDERMACQCRIISGTVTIDV